MNKNYITEKILNSLAQIEGGDKKESTSISLDSSLGDLSIDSLKLVEMIYDLESHFDVQADETLLAELETVGDIIHMFNVACEERSVPA